MNEVWSARAFAALDHAEGVATVLLGGDFVVRWASSSWQRMFGYDPIGEAGLDVLHPDDVPFALSVLDHHTTFHELYAERSGRDETVPPSGDLRLRHADGSWLRCLVRLDNQLTNPDVQAVVVHIVRAIDASGLGKAIASITNAAPVDDALLNILAYMAEDGIRHNQGPCAVIWHDESGERRVTTHTDPGVAAALFGDGVVPIERSGDRVEVVYVADLPDGDAKSMAVRLGQMCCWVIRVGDTAGLGDIVSWSAYDSSLDLGPHVHFSIGIDVIGLALQEHRRRQAIQRYALTDPLTGVFNRAGLADQFVAHDKAVIGVLFIDLDDFKKINDTYGHPVGDEVLTEVANRLRAVSRDIDIVARIGGDEFVIACPVHDRGLLLTIGERVQHAMRSPVVTSAGAVTVRVSIGTSNAVEHAELDALLRDADSALYEAKRASKAHRAVRLLA